MKKILLSLFVLLAYPVAVGRGQTLEKVTPADPQLFTQGFELDKDGRLLLGSGMYGQSQLGILDPETGVFDSKVALDERVFGEGITRAPGGIWQLTWKAGQAFLYDPQSFTLLKQVTYPGEGWGLAYDADRQVLWMSDGSSKLFRRDPETFDLIGSLEVKDITGQPISQLNELEYAKGLVYANIWQTNHIVAINPETGQIVKDYDFTQILAALDLSPQQRQQMDVLNGIAYVEGDRFLVTGKYYPVVMEVILN